MDLQLKPGTYVVAVSGGVDSMTLLDVLAKLPNLKLIVAHLDHGIRPDSAVDLELVRTAANHYGLPFVFDQAALGPAASEAEARQARYGFLRRVAKASGARAIVTAHHQDDLLETAILNLLRGTGRRGLISLSSRQDILRPLLHVPKWQILDYAAAHKLNWRNDSTNQDERYRRNYVRRQIMPKLHYEHRQTLLSHIQSLRKLNAEIEMLLANQLHQQPASGVLDRHWFVMLPHSVAKEAMAQWLRAHGVQNYDAKTLERLVVAAKTQQAGKMVDVNHVWVVRVEKDKLALQARDR